MCTKRQKNPLYFPANVPRYLVPGRIPERREVLAARRADLTETTKLPWEIRGTGYTASGAVLSWALIFQTLCSTEERGSHV